MINPRFYGGAGSVNAGITSYGFRALPSPTEAMNCTELWNGTSWSETVEAILTGEHGVEYGTQNAFVVTAGTGDTHILLEKQHNFLMEFLIPWMQI